MREIKFRAWDKKNKEFITQLHSIDFLFKSIHGGFPFVGSMDYPFERVEIMQYTGLKDKNGKEIYEGDIIDTSPHMQGDPYIKDKPYCYCHVVEYKKAKYWVFYNYEDFEAPSKMEVIGNIYENPEILKDL